MTETDPNCEDQKLEAISRLAAGVAHDFNNLLCAIVASAHWAMDECGTEGACQEALEDILRASNRASALAHRLLAFGGRQVLCPTVIDLNENIKELLRMLDRCVGPDIRIALELNAQPCRILADAGQMEQVLMNLVLNARDAMPDGGALLLRTRTEDAHVVLTVTDDGIGMTAETRARVFEPFYTTKPRARGTGLGLASVYGIVTQSGGRVHVDSEPGEGSTFEVRLPKVD